MDSARLKIDLRNLPGGDIGTTKSAPPLKIIGKAICLAGYFAKDKGRGLYVYHGGRYVGSAEDTVEWAYSEVLKQHGTDRFWSEKKMRELITWIRVQAARLLWDRPPLDQINLVNGIYNLKSGQLMPHTPDWLSTVQIPIKYDPEAKCPGWGQFLEDVLPQWKELPVDIIGLCMTPATAVQKAIVLVGPGSNGKSTFLNGLQAAIGEENISNLSLQQITDWRDRFAKSALVGKLVNVCGDVPNTMIADPGNFKAIVGEDTIMIDEKYKRQYSYKPMCKLIFSCNELMRSQDGSYGYTRKFLNVPFIQQFAVDPKKGMQLANVLRDPTELSGLFNLVKDRIKIVLENGFTMNPMATGADAPRSPEAESVNDESVKWVMDNVQEMSGEELPSTRFYTYYQANCKQILARVTLLGLMERMFPSMTTSDQKWVNGKHLRYCGNVRMKDPTVHRALWEEMI